MDVPVLFTLLSFLIAVPGMILSILELFERYKERKNVEKK